MRLKFLVELVEYLACGYIASLDVLPELSRYFLILVGEGVHQLLEVIGVGDFSREVFDEEEHVEVEGRFVVLRSIFDGCRGGKHHGVIGSHDIEVDAGDGASKLFDADGIGAVDGWLLAEFQEEIDGDVFQEPGNHIGHDVCQPAADGSV